MVETRSRIRGPLSSALAASLEWTPRSTSNVSLRDRASIADPLRTSPPSSPNFAGGRPKVLCLGMSYPSLEKQLKSYGVSPEEWLQGRSVVTVKDVLKCVKDGMLTEMDARDLARCVATEIAANVEVYTVSQEKAALYDTRRHLFANFNRHSFVYQLHRAFATDQNGIRQAQEVDIARRRSFHADYKIRYRQAILDYFWIPQGWDHNHWSRSFFDDILPDLVRQGMLDVDDNINVMDNVPCGVYLPFCLHCFQQIVNALPLLRKFYSISFLRKKDLHEISLWEGTQTIDPYDMRKCLGKDRDQENIYCTFGYQEVMEAGSSPRDEPKDTLVDILSQLEDFSEIRMIKLRPLRQYHPTLAVTKEEHEKGGLEGLVDPKLIKRGFMATVGGRRYSESLLEIEATTKKKPPSTPLANYATSTTRSKRPTTRSKRKRPPGIATPCSKKTPTRGPPGNARPRPSAKSAHFHRASLAMATRSTSRALAKLPPPPCCASPPLLDSPSSSSRRPSQRYINFVSLSKKLKEKCRPSSPSTTITRGGEVAEQREVRATGSSNNPTSTPLASSKQPEKKSEEKVSRIQALLRVNVHAADAKENYDVTPSIAALSASEKHNPGVAKASQGAIVRVAELGNIMVTMGPNPAPTALAKSDLTSMVIVTPPTPYALQLAASRYRKAPSISAPTMTSSPFASLFETNANSTTAQEATTKHLACRAFLFGKVSQDAGEGKLEPRSKGGTQNEARETTLDANCPPPTLVECQPDSMNEETPNLQPGPSSQALSFTAKAGLAEELVRSKVAKSYHRSLLVTTTTRQAPPEVSVETSSADEVDKSFAKIESEFDTRSVSVLEVSVKLDYESIDGTSQPAVFERDELSAFALDIQEPGLSTKERLIYLEGKLHAAARMRLSKPKPDSIAIIVVHGGKFMIRACTNPFLTKKARTRSRIVGSKSSWSRPIKSTALVQKKQASSTKKREGVENCRISCKLRQQDSVARIHEGQLIRPRITARHVPESILMQLG